MFCSLYIYNNKIIILSIKYKRKHESYFDFIRNFPFGGHVYFSFFFLLKAVHYSISIFSPQEINYPTLIVFLVKTAISNVLNLEMNRFRSWTEFFPQALCSLTIFRFLMIFQYNKEFSKSQKNKGYNWHISLRSLRIENKWVFQPTAKVIFVQKQT